MNPTQNTPNAESHFNAPRTNENEVGNIQTPQSKTKVLRAILNRIQRVLRPLLELTEREIARIDAGELTTLWCELPGDYGQRLSAALARLNTQLYAYFLNNWYDPLQLRKDQRSGKLQMVEELYDAVKVRVTDSAVDIYLPYLPPRTHHRDCLVHDLLLARILEEPNMPRWKRHRITFYHVYPSETIHIPRDLDNFYYKRTIDILEMAMRQSDCSICCSLKMTARFTDLVPPGVYIRISPESSEKSEKEISDFSYLHVNRSIK